MNKRISIVGIIALLLFAVACGEGNKEGTSESSADLTGNDYLVTIKTDLGEMKAILYDKTPQHKENFLKLINEGFYDSLLFHRVIQGFMIQGGDPDSKNAQPGQRLGGGGPGYTVPAEFVTELFHKKGALAAARRGDQQNPERASSGSQFYIVQGTVASEEDLAYDQQKIGQALQVCLNQMPESELAKSLNEARMSGDQQLFVDKVYDSVQELEELTGIDLASTMPKDRVEAYTTVGGTPALDDQYTVFGEVISGIDIVDSVAGVQTAPGDRPVEDVRMYISVEEMPKAEIAEKYGYNYK